MCYVTGNRKTYMCETIYNVLKVNLGELERLNCDCFSSACKFLVLDMPLFAKQQNFTIEYQIVGLVF